MIHYGNGPSCKSSYYHITLHAECTAHRIGSRPSLDSAGSIYSTADRYPFVDMSALRLCRTRRLLQPSPGILSAPRVVRTYLKPMLEMKEQVEIGKLTAILVSGTIIVLSSSPISTSTHAEFTEGIGYLPSSSSQALRYNNADRIREFRRLANAPPRSQDWEVEGPMEDICGMKRVGCTG